jgi:hypothetical protein
MSDKRIHVEQRGHADLAVRRANSKRASAVESSQAEAIDRAKQIEPDASVHVERVPHTSKGEPDQWRKE